MARTQTATCQDCGWQGPVEDTLEFRHLHERVLPGDVMPAGDCPEEGCGGAAMLDVEHDGEPDLRPALEALMLGLDRLHEAICCGCARRLRSRPRQATRGLRPHGTRSGPAAATRMQYLRRNRRPGGCLGVLGYASAALGAAQHL